MLVGFLTIPLANAVATAQQTEPDTSNAGTQAQSLEEVSVTATRVSRKGFEAPTPTTQFGQDELQARNAVDIATVLYELPSVRPSQTAVVGSANSGFNIANLRSLNGSYDTRTLVLVDGQRFVPTNPQGQIDMNVIPVALIDRVDVVTGGASAAWGSDAVAGVVNLILKKELNGFVGSMQYGESQRGDDNEQGFSLAWGSGFDDNRGQFMVAGEYSKLYDVPLQDDRAWGRTQTGVNTPGNGSIISNGVTYSRVAQPGLTLSGLTYGGVIVANSGGAPLLSTNKATGVQSPNSPLSGIQFGPGSTVEPFVYGKDVGTQFMQGGSGDWTSGLEPLTAPIQRDTFYSRITFDITPSTNVFADLSHSQTASSLSPTPDAEPNNDAALMITANNAYIQTQPGLAPLKAILAANPSITSFYLGRINTEFGVADYDTHSSVTRVAAGFDSALTDTWKLSGYATYGYSGYNLEIKNDTDEANLRASMAAISANGQIVCNPVTVASFKAAAGCVPSNPFGQGSISAAAVQYIVGTANAYDEYRQGAVGASLQGEPFSTWAGPVSIVGGYEFRNESLSANSDPISQSSTTAYPSGGFQIGDYKRYGGSYHISEGFAETVVPLLANQPFAKSLDFNAAFRGANYSTSGYVSSDKLGLTYKPIDELLLRGTISRDERAPNLYELYTVGKLTTAQVFDYSTGTAVLFNNAQAITNGYSKLTPEIGQTVTYGITWSPSFVRGLSASVDGYKIQVKNAIGNLGAQNIVNACEGHGVPQNTSFCQFITRDTSGNIIRVTDAIVNSTSSLTTDGFDIELNYGTNLSEFASNVPGHLTVRVLGTYVDHFKTFNGTTTTDTAGDVTSPYGTPRWRSNVMETYQNGRYTFFLQENFIGGAKLNNTYDVINKTDIYNNSVPSEIYLNASAQYTLYDNGRHKLAIFGDINNLLDRWPALNPSTSGSVAFYSNSQFYDTIGRAFKGGVRFTY